MKGNYARRPGLIGWDHRYERPVLARGVRTWSTIAVADMRPEPEHAAPTGFGHREALIRRGVENGLEVICDLGHHYTATPAEVLAGAPCPRLHAPAPAERHLGIAVKPFPSAAEVLAVAREHGTTAATLWSGRSQRYVASLRRKVDGYQPGRGRPTKAEAERGAPRHDCKCPQCVEVFELLAVAS